MSWALYKGINVFNVDMVLDDYKKISVLNYSFYFKTNNRFEDDKLFIENDAYVFLIDGVLLNKIELYGKYQVDNMKHLITILYEQHKEPFINKLRGPFSGAIYDKKLDKLIIFGNQTGDTHVFYFTKEDEFFTSTNFNEIVDYLKSCGISYTFGENATKQMLTFGYLIDKDTFIDEIKRVQPGYALLLEKNTLKESQYYYINNEDTLNVSIEEAVELIDKEFKKAVKRCFEKDIEYGYKYHLVDISGGLDSRMVTWVSNVLGYKNITNISYSQSKTNEQKYASLIASTLRNEFIHKQLDDITFLFKPEEILKMNFGLAYYSGITGGEQLLSALNFNKFGLEHTGQLGDVIIGSYVSVIKHLPVDITKKRLSHHIQELGVDLSKYKNQEQYLFMTRGMQGILSTHCTRRNFTEAVSPFIDVDFMNLCFSIPLKYRANHKLYFKWIEKKYPEVLEIKSTTEKSVSRPDRYLIFSKFAYHRLKYELKVRLYRKGIIDKFNSPYNNMNPYRYWYETNSALRDFLKAYYDSEINSIKDDKIRKFIQESFKSQVVEDKIAAITVLGMHKIHFDNI